MTQTYCIEWAMTIISGLPKNWILDAAKDLYRMKMLHRARPANIQCRHFRFPQSRLVTALDVSLAKGFEDLSLNELIHTASLRHGAHEGHRCRRRVGRRLWPYGASHPSRPPESRGRTRRVWRSTTSARRTVSQRRRSTFPERPQTGATSGVGLDTWTYTLSLEWERGGRRGCSSSPSARHGVAKHCGIVRGVSEHCSR